MPSTTIDFPRMPDHSLPAERPSRRRPETNLVILCVSAIMLFSLWPLLNFANANRVELDWPGAIFLLTAFTVTVLVVLLGFWLGSVATRWRRPVAVAISGVVFLILFFNYYLLYDGLVWVFGQVGLNRGQNPAYLVIVILACILSFLFLNYRLILEFLVAFGVVVNMIPGVDLVVFAGSMETQRVVLGIESDHVMKQKPDIFHIIQDSYARQDSLLRDLNYDNSTFLDSLRDRGFYIVGESYSNYSTTFLSLSSMLKMEYQVTETTRPFSSRTVFSKVSQGENPVVEQLHNNGYRYVHQGAVTWDGSKCSPIVDVCLSTGRAFENAILYLTPLRRFIETGRPTTAVNVEDRLDDILDGVGPIYLFAHSIPPHPPRTFTSECTHIRLLSSRPLTDYWGDREGYVRDLNCVNEHLLSLVDAIVARSPDAVIIINGDHGSGFGVDPLDPDLNWTEEQIKIRFSILLAIRLPSECYRHLYPTLSPINIYPLIFGCLAQIDPLLKPDKLYVSPNNVDHPAYGTALLVRRPST